MAGVKVTDLTPLGSAAATDILYIVDEGANQSKKIEVQNIYSGMPQFESGTYTPTVSGENFCSGTLADGIYSRVGDVVTVSLRIETVVDIGESSCSFNLSPPIGSDFVNAKGFFATIGYSDTNEVVIGGVQSDETFNQLTVVINISTPSAPTTLQYIYITGQYVIV